MLYAILLGASETLIKPDPAFVTLLSTAVIPLLVGLITKKYTSKAVKALTNAFVVAVVATLALASANGLTLKAFITAVFIGFLTSSAAHQFIWKNLGVSEYVANVSPDTGLGAPVNEPIDNRYSAAALDLDTALEYLDDPNVTLTHGFDPNAPHGENPELIDRKDVR